MFAFLDDILSHLKTDPRTAAMRQIASHNRWRFMARRKMDRQPVELQAFELFKGKGNKRVLSAISLSTSLVEGRFRCYDYQYYGDFKNRLITIFEYSNPQLKLSPFSIRPKGRFAAVKEIFLTSELLFATSPDFNKRYEIMPQDKAAIKMDLNEEFLDEVGDEAGWTYEGNGHFLLAYQVGKQLAIPEIEPQIKRFTHTCERLINGLSPSDFV